MLLIDNVSKTFQVVHAWLCHVSRLTCTWKRGLAGPSHHHNERIYSKPLQFLPSSETGVNSIYDWVEEKQIANLQKFCFKSLARAGHINNGYATSIGTTLYSYLNVASSLPQFSYIYIPAETPPFFLTSREESQIVDRSPQLYFLSRFPKTEFTSTHHTRWHP